MHAAIEIVTLQNAKDYIADGAPNRKISEATVRRYARDMKLGRWINNGQGIVICSKGKLLDGQHRMRAIIEAQTPVSMLVVRGVDADSFVTMDTGKTRSLGDVLSIQGHHYTNTMAGIARGAYAYAAGANYKYLETKVALESFVKAHPYIAEVAALVGARSRQIPKAPLGTVLFLANERRTLDIEVKEFFEGVIYGEGLYKGDARLTLRDWVAAQRTHDRGKHGTIGQEVMFAAVGRAWNAYAAGKELLVLKMLQKPNRENLQIFGYDQTLYADVPDIPVRLDETRRSNIAPHNKKRAKIGLLAEPVVQ